MCAQEVESRPVVRVGVLRKIQLEKICWGQVQVLHAWLKAPLLFWRSWRATGGFRARHWHNQSGLGQWGARNGMGYDWRLLQWSGEKPGQVCWPGSGQGCACGW